jgi:hypothetical protein
LYFDADYQDQASVSGGVTYTRLNLKAGLPTLNQTAGFASGRIHLTPALLPGRLSLRVDGHQINNDDTSNETDNVQAIAPQISFLDSSKSFYADLGYALSVYGNSAIGNGSLTVQQWTPTIGFSFNQRYDWLQLRLYDIGVSNPLRAMHNNTDAVEIKLTHHFTPESPWLPYWVSVGGLVGRRMYAVDADTALVYNLADEQQGGGFVAAQWKLTGQYKATLSGSYDVYRAHDVIGGGQYEYTGVSIYLGMTAQW